MVDYIADYHVKDRRWLTILLTIMFRKEMVDYIADYHV